MDSNNLDLELINQAIDILNEGGIIIYPTDTVYGLGANVFNEKAIKKIYSIKKRDYSKPISVSFPDIQSLSYFTELSISNRKIINEKLPGPFTFILNQKPNVPNRIAIGIDKIGVRIPDNQIAIELTKKFPITATSANISTKKTLSSPKEIAKQLNYSVDLAIDVGALNSNKSSTVVDLTKEDPIILREGIGIF
jgi:L-threonylcarbamoyladenylate synthase